MACNYRFPHEDKVLNKFRIWKERHFQMRKPYQSPVRMKNSSYYIAPDGDRTHDLPHTVAPNMVKVSHALNHSATAAVASSTNCLRPRFIHFNPKFFQSLSYAGTFTLWLIFYFPHALYINCDHHLIRRNCRYHYETFVGVFTVPNLLYITPQWFQYDGCWSSSK